MMKSVALSLLLIPLLGCAHFGKEMAYVSQAIAHDPATFVVDVALTTPWGSQTVKMTRIGGSSNSVSVTPDRAVSINPPAAQPAVR